MNQLVKANKTEIFNFAESDMKTCMDMAEMMSISDLVPKDFKNKPGNILLAVQMGSEVGLKPMQALQNVAVINGRPCLWGDSVLAVVQSSRDAEGKKILTSFNETFDKETMTATCTAKRSDIEHPYTAEFSQEDAERAGLWGRTGPWKTYPKRMLAMRARGFCLRNGFADILGGFNVAEEIRDMPKEKVVGEQAAVVADMLGVKDAKPVVAEKPKEPVTFGGEEIKPHAKHVQTQDEFIAAMGDIEEGSFTEVNPNDEKVEAMITRMECAGSLKELDDIVPDLAIAPKNRLEELRVVFKTARSNLQTGE